MTSRSGLMGQVGTVVVKVGTSSITRGGRTVSTEFMDSVAEQVRKVRAVPCPKGEELPKYPATSLGKKI